MRSPAERPDVDERELLRALDRFGGNEGERRAVARAASDLAAAGTYAEDAGVPLDVETVVANLADARDGGPADRWNWWLGSLEAAYGGYRDHQVRRWPEG